MSVTESPQPVQCARAGWLSGELSSPSAAPELMSALFEGSPDMVVVVDEEQRIVAANSRALADFGYTRGEIEGQPVSMLLPESARERHEEHVRAFQESPSVRSMGSGMNLKARHASGSEFPVDVMLWPLAAASGRHVLAVCRRPDAALARSHAQMHSLVDTVRDYAINLLDAHGRILTWNDGSRRIHGLSSAEALGQNISIFFFAEDIARGEPQRLLAEAASTGHSHAEGRRKGVGGNAIWAEVDFTAIRDGSGQLTGFTRVLHDMTEHREKDERLLRINRALVESDERLRLLLESVTDYAIYRLDPEGHVVTWNVGAERNKGYKAEEVMGKSFSMFFLPEDAAARVPQLELDAAAREGRFETEAWRVRKDGSKFWALVTLTAIRGLNGELRGFAKVTRDITAQKQASEALRNLNAELDQYRIMVENIEDYAIYTLDPEGCITSWGKGAQHVGRTPGEMMLGRNFSSFFSAGDVLAGVPAGYLEEAARTGRSATDGWMITPDGRRVWSNGAISAVRDEAGQLTGFVRVARDMTAQKQAEEELRKLNAELYQYRIMVENVEDYAIYTLDPEGRVTSLGRGAQQAGGKPAEEILGRPFTGFFSDKDVQAGVPAGYLEEAARTGKSITDGWMIALDGRRAWSTGVITAVRDEAGQLTGFIRVARDMTAQKQAEEELRSLNLQLERHRIVVENIDEYSIYTLDPEGRITSWEAGAQKNSGVGPEVMIGRNYSQFFSAEEVAAGVPAQELAEAARNGRLATESWRITPKGERVWGVGTLNAVRDANGQMTGFVRIARMMTKQKEAEEALHALNAQLQRYRIIVENIADYGIFMLDSEGRINSWEASAQKMTGVPPEVMLGRPYATLAFTPEDLAAGVGESHLAEAARNGRCVTEGWRITPNGERVWSVGSLNAVRDEAGRLTGFVRIARVMTQQKEAEDALRALNAELDRYRVIVDTIDEYAIYALDATGHFVTWGKGAQKLSGLAAEEALGRHFSIFDTGPDGGEAARELEEAERLGSYSFEGWRRRPTDGVLMWASGELTTIRDHAGRLTGFTRVTRNMTKQKEADDALRALNAELERYRIILENVRDHVVFAMDPDGRIASWSAGSEKVVGYTAEEAIGQPYSLLFTPDGVAAGEGPLELEAAARNGQCSTASWRQRKDGVQFWATGETTAIRDPDGKLTGFVRVARDMTQQKMLEESLARLAADLEIRVAERTRQLELTVDELRRKNEEVEAFVYIVSHDLRAPLVNVQGFARELELSCATLKSILSDAGLARPTIEAVREVLESDIGGALKFIAASASKFERLIDALLGLSRQGRQVYQPVRVDTHALVEQSVASMQHLIDQAQGRVTVHELPMVTADLTALGQVFSNLIANCVKYRDRERRLKIEIGGDAADGKTHYWVRDNGLGIPESGKSRLFQVFQRFHPQLAPGEGMGLAIANLIVQRHRGKIWAESREGLGTTVHFTLPDPGQPAQAEGAQCNPPA